MKKLIICEKPSLARTVLSAIEDEKFSKKDGYYENSKYIIVPAFGHLFTLADIEKYLPDFDKSKKYKWTLDNLPCLPKHKFVLPEDVGIKKQFKIIKSLIHREDVDDIIHCGDSDREGEIIVRIILFQAKNNKPVYRLWLPNQAENTIRQAINNLIDDKNYDNLANEGYARMFIDWNYGVNLTRYATLKSGTLLNVGRVISSIVKTIYDRDQEIKNFKPEKYFEICSEEQNIYLKYKDTFSVSDKEQALNIVNGLNSQTAVVANISDEEKVVAPPKLFSQSNLQNVLSKKFGYSPDKTLSLVQSLYEKGYLSYPRTETEYLSVNEQNSVKEVINSIKNNFDVDIIFKDTKRIFDDSKIKSHSAITPTTKIPDLNTLSDDEKNCYITVLNRFNSAFYNEDCIISQRTVEIQIGSEKFKITGKTPIKQGWKSIDKSSNDTEKEVLLPNLNIGDNVPINFKLLEKETKPKKLFTVETLNNYLKNPFREEAKEETDDEDYKAFLNGLEIGTEATRPDIIKRAIKMEYIDLKKSTYSILPKGVFLVETLEKLKIDMSKEKTVYMNKLITDVYKGDISIEQALNEVNEEIKNIFEQNIEIDKSQFSKSDNVVIGICPKCGKNIYENSKTFYCENDKNVCGFMIWKNVAQKNISVTQVKKLLTKRKTDLIKGFTSKSGKSFDAYLIIKDDFTIGFEFEKKK